MYKLVSNVLTTAVDYGVSFLPSPEPYDDMFEYYTPPSQPAADERHDDEDDGAPLLDGCTAERSSPMEIGSTEVNDAVKESKAPVEPVQSPPAASNNNPWAISFLPGEELPKTYADCASLAAKYPEHAKAIRSLPLRSSVPGPSLPTNVNKTPGKFSRTTNERNPAHRHERSRDLSTRTRDSHPSQNPFGRERRFAGLDKENNRPMLQWRPGSGFVDHGVRAASGPGRGRGRGRSIETRGDQGRMTTSPREMSSRFERIDRRPMGPRNLRDGGRPSATSDTSAQVHDLMTVEGRVRRQEAVTACAPPKVSAGVSRIGSYRLPIPVRPSRKQRDDAEKLEGGPHVPPAPPAPSVVVLATEAQVAVEDEDVPDVVEILHTEQAVQPLSLTSSSNAVPNTTQVYSALQKQSLLSASGEEHSIDQITFQLSELAIGTSSKDHNVELDTWAECSPETKVALVISPSPSEGTLGTKAVEYFLRRMNANVTAENRAYDVVAETQSGSPARTTLVSQPGQAKGTPASLVTPALLMHSSISPASPSSVSSLPATPTPQTALGSSLHQLQPIPVFIIRSALFDKVPQTSHSSYDAITNIEQSRVDALPDSGVNSLSEENPFGEMTTPEPNAPTVQQYMKCLRIELPPPKSPISSSQVSRRTPPRASPPIPSPRSPLPKFMDPEVMQGPAIIFRRAEIALKTQAGLESPSLPRSTRRVNVGLDFDSAASPSPRPYPKSSIESKEVSMMSGFEDDFLPSPRPQLLSPAIADPFTATVDVNSPMVVDFADVLDRETGTFGWPQVDDDLGWGLFVPKGNDAVQRLGYDDSQAIKLSSKARQQTVFNYDAWELPMENGESRRVNRCTVGEA